MSSSLKSVVDHHVIDLRDTQRSVLWRVLSLNAGSGGHHNNDTNTTTNDAGDDEKVGGGNEWDVEWKVLIYDQACQDIVVPLVTIADLQQLGITLHLLITNKRQPVPDVPAVYFVRPTAENLALIAQDTEMRMYDSMYLNFSTSVPRPLLEQLAERTVQSQSSATIAKVFDQYCDFVCLEAGLFSLNQRDSYVCLNDPKREAGLVDSLEFIVDGLFSMVATLGRVPIIRCKQGDCSQEIAQRLTARIREHLAQRSNLFSERRASATSFHRPVLVILDRNVDLSVTLHHTWTYQSLVHDLLGMRANRVQLAAAASSASSSSDAGGGGGGGGDSDNIKTYDLDHHDAFWSRHAGHMFHEVAVAVEGLLKEHQEAKNRIGARGMDALAAHASDMDSMTDDLSNTIDKLPELQRQKHLLDVHMNMATALLKQIKARKLDEFYGVEEECMAGGAVTAESVLEKLAGENGTSVDKLRLLLIYYLSNATNKASTDQIQQALLTGATKTADAEAAAASVAARQRTGGPGGGNDVFRYSPNDGNFFGALDYLKQLQFTANLQSVGLGASRQSGGAASADGSGMSGLLSSFAGKVYGKSVGLLAGIKSLLPMNKDFTVTRIVDELMENRDSPTTQNMLYYDPKAKSKGPIKRNRITTPFREAIVFTIGGGNYAEYQNLRDYAARTSTPQLQKKIAYGTTELVSPTEFLLQLTKCGVADDDIGGLD